MEDLFEGSGGSGSFQKVVEGKWGDCLQRRLSAEVVHQRKFTSGGSQQRRLPLAGEGNFQAAYANLALSI